MKPKPCLSPIRALLPSGVYSYVPCGHCPACLMAKGYQRVNKINQGFLSFHYRYFITLTYSDEFLPIARFDELTESFVHPHDVDYLGVVKSYPLANVIDKDKDFILSCCEKFGGVPVLSHSDVRNFKKRFRKNLFNILKTYENIYFSVVGEYGPTTFRPHYHCVLSFENAAICKEIEGLVFKSWSLQVKDSSGTSSSRQIGIVDIQACSDSGATNYCAQYMSCVTHLPKILSSNPFRQFLVSSRPFHKEIRHSDDEIRKEFFDCSPYRIERRVENNQLTSSRCSSRGKSFVFPLYPRIGELSSIACEQLCGLWPFYARKFPNNSVRKLAEIIYSFITFQKPIRSFDFVLLDLISNRRPLHRSFVIDKWSAFNFITRVLAVSRRITLNCQICGTSFAEYCRQIDLFRSRCELAKLKDFYEMQDELMKDKFHPIDKSDLFFLYYDTQYDCKHLSYYMEMFGVNAFSSVDFIPSQINYSQLSQKIIRDTTKTKKRNDYFIKKGLKRKPWIPRISKRINQLLTI